MEQFTEANAKQHTSSADSIFSSTLIKNHMVEERKKGEKKEERSNQAVRGGEGGRGGSESRERELCREPE